MFKSRRSGLVRRLWRSRLLTEGDARDGSRHGGGGRSAAAGKLHRHEPRSVTRADAAPGLPGEAAGELAECAAEREDDEQADDERRGAVCAPERRSSRRGQEEADGGTVTCCLFGEWELKARSSHPHQHQHHHHGSSGHEDELASTAHAFLKRLKERSLDALVKAVESKGCGECVMVPGTELRLGAHHVPPHYLLCRVYRWAELPLSARLKALCHCQSFGGAAESTKVCCNPYHYSRLCGPESPPPPYTLSCSEELKPLDASLSYTEAVPPIHSGPPRMTPREYTDTDTSLGSSASSGHRSHWCSVAYWEQRTRVGRLYPAYEPWLNIFYDLPQGTGLCLGQLQANAYHSRREDPGSHSSSGLNGHYGHSGRGSGGGGGGSSSSVQQIRSKIGFGIVLSQEPDGVWVYNRSQHPVFIHSPTLDPPSARGLSVKRVMPGFSLKVFDYERSSWMAKHGVKPESQEGPWDPHSVRISFAKGWGPCYSRQFITSCPCWLEVLLNNHR